MSDPGQPALVCVNCGGALEATAEADLLRCPACRQLMTIARPAAASPYRVATRLVSRREWAANALRPDDARNWLGGTLCLTDDALAFVPHAFNVGALDRSVLAVGDVARVEMRSGIVSDDLTVVTRDGDAWVFRLRHGDELRDALAALDVTVG